MQAFRGRKIRGDRPVVRPYFSCSQKRQKSLWTQIIPPQLRHVHFCFSCFRKCLIPDSFMVSRFLIMLMPYFVRYRLSSCFSRLQGNLSHLKQYSCFVVFKFSQFFILHTTQYFGLLVSFAVHPGHVFFFLRYAWQSAQFIPQGAMDADLIKVGYFILRLLLPVTRYSP